MDAEPPPPAGALMGDCGCEWEKLRPRRRAVVKAFLSVERNCNSLNSFSAANVDASSIDHAGAARRRPAKDAMHCSLYLNKLEACVYTVHGS